MATSEDTERRNALQLQKTLRRESLLEGITSGSSKAKEHPAYEAALEGYATTKAIAA